MDDYTHLLYESLLNQYPYTPSTPSEYDAAQRMETARARVKRIPKAYRHNLFELTDSLDNFDLLPLPSRISSGIGFWALHDPGADPVL